MFRLEPAEIGGKNGCESWNGRQLGARSCSHFPSDGYALVHLLRRIGGSIHPGLLEHLEDDLSDLEKRRILIDAMMECSSYEIDALLYIRYGDHGSDHIGVLTEILANLHTPLKDRVAVCRMVSGSYEMAQATGTDPDPNGTAPKMEILYQAQDAGTEAAMKSNDSYTVNPNNISG